MSMKHVEAEKNRNGELRLLDRDLLKRCSRLPTPEVQKDADVPPRMLSATSSPRIGPVTVYLAAAMLSWPIFSSSVMAARSESMRFVGAWINIVSQSGHHRGGNLKRPASTAEPEVYS